MVGNNNTLKFSLIICTFQRPESLKRLLFSVTKQSLYPNEIIIVDGSRDKITKRLLQKQPYKNLKYYRVGENERGLTRQRNYGISKTNSTSEIICFLDDDIVLNENYFQCLIKTYKNFPDAIAVGGTIINEPEWQLHIESDRIKNDEFFYDGYVRKLGLRNLIRKKLNLLSDKLPGFMPEFSHGLSTSFLPPTGKTYPVEFFMGGVSSYKKVLFEKISFSEYFEGYGLYEDMDFCLRTSRIGELYVNTGAKVEHLHEEAGRPDYYKYGKMVVRNGYYVWKVKNPNPDFLNILKWNSITFLLILIRFSNIFNTNERIKSFEDFFGRIMGWLSLIFNKPR